MTVEIAAHPQFEQHGGFGHLRLGRKPKRTSPKQLQFARYLAAPAELPATPASVDYASAVASWPMYDNDSLGDCTCAAAGHMVQAWSAAAGGLKTYDDSDVVGLYWATGSQDDGRDEMSVLDFWRQTGIAPNTSYVDKIVAYAAVDPSNLDHVRLATYLFGGVYTGIELPLTAQGQQVWDIADEPQRNQPGSWGGHAVPIEAYDEDGFVVVTWGGTLRMTNAFWQEYGDEAFAIVSPDFLAAGQSPEGFDLERLEADLTEMTQS